MAENENEIIRERLIQWLRSWTGNRPDELLSFYDKDCVYIDSFGKFYGHSQLKPYFGKLLQSNAHWVWEMTSLNKHEKKSNSRNIGLTMEWKATIPMKLDTFNVTGIDLVELDPQSYLVKFNHVFFHANDEYQRYMKAANESLKSKKRLSKL